jgi:hypothetical protein
MFCLVTDLTDIEEHQAPQLAALYEWRWDGSETALREAKAYLDGAGPGIGPMPRSQSSALVRQELAAWAAATEMTCGVARDAAAAAIPARKGPRAGQPVRPRGISCARARRAAIAAIRVGRTCYQALTREIAKYRVAVDRNRHRIRKSKSPSSLGHATAKDTRTRIAPAIITMATPGLTSTNWRLPAVTKTRKPTFEPKRLNPLALGLYFTGAPSVLSIGRPPGSSRARTPSRTAGQDGVTARASRTEVGQVRKKVLARVSRRRTCRRAPAHWRGSLH